MMKTKEINAKELKNINGGKFLLRRKRKEATKKARLFF